MEEKLEESTYFEDYEKSELIGDEEILNESNVVYILKPKKGSYEGAAGPYAFTIAGSNDTLSRVKISDEDFCGKLASGQFKFHYTDVVKAQVTIRQKIKQGQMLPPQYEITKVLEYRAPSRHDLLVIAHHGYS
jgi:hypothetical protein